MDRFERLVDVDVDEDDLDGADTDEFEELLKLVELLLVLELVVLLEFLVEVERLFTFL